MPIKSTSTTEGENKREKKIQKNLQNKSKHKNNKCFSWVTAVRVLSLPRSHSPPHLRMPSNTVLSSGPAVGVAQILIWSYSNVFLPPMSTAIRTSAFSFVGDLNDLLYKRSLRAPAKQNAVVLIAVDIGGRTQNRSRLESELPPQQVQRSAQC